MEAGQGFRFASLSGADVPQIFKMQVHRTLPTSPILSNCALTIGTFDGVHRGHQALIGQLKSEADKRGLQSVALTFDDMPICLLRPEVCPLLLTLPDEKIEAFARTPLDHLFVVPFTREIAAQRAEAWMRSWVDNIGLKLFIGGPDFALGRNREGSIAQLGVIGRDLGFEAFALRDKLVEGGLPISSTRSRQIIESGQVELAPAFLGRRYRLSGDVVSGQQLGRTIGFPTINVRPHARKCLPANGVYAVRAYWDGRTFAAALNIGKRPTVSGTVRQIEFHVLDENISQPPPEVQIEFVARLRDETKFNNLQSLADQLGRDVEDARQKLSAA